jgi:uncharacterized membrane protein YqiK
MGTLIYAGIILAALVVIGIILTRLYRRATKDVALIRTGFGGEKVVLNGGIMVIPVLHELMQVRLTTVKLEVSRLNKDALITLDKLRVDVIGLFHIKVKPDAGSIAAAAQTLGAAVNSSDAVKSLLDGKLVSALRSVAATMTMEHLHANRADFIQKVQEALMTDLDMNGFQLESVSITHFDQTAFEHFNENNAFDAEGLTVLTRTIEERKKIRNDIVATNRVEIEQRNLEANKQSLEIAQAAEQARLTQNRRWPHAAPNRPPPSPRQKPNRPDWPKSPASPPIRRRLSHRPRPTRSSRARISPATARSRRLRLNVTAPLKSRASPRQYKPPRNPKKIHRHCRRQ